MNRQEFLNKNANRIVTNTYDVNIAKEYQKKGYTLASNYNNFEVVINNDITTDGMVVTSELNGRVTIFSKKGWYVIITEEELEMALSLLNELDESARGYDEYEFGLPLVLYGEKSQLTGIVIIVFEFMMKMKQMK